jgi:hypothetical protein
MRSLMAVVPAASQARVGVLETDHCFATWGPIFICIWRHDTTLAGVNTLTERVADFARTAPGDGVGLLTIVEQNAPVPDSKVRDALAGFMKKSAGALRSSAVVHEGTGFRSAAVRGVVTGLTMLARQAFPHRVFATVEEGSRWLVGSLRQTANQNVNDDMLIAVVSELRKRIAAA